MKELLKKVMLCITTLLVACGLYAGVINPMIEPKETTTVTKETVQTISLKHGTAGITAAIMNVINEELKENEKPLTLAQRAKMFYDAIETDDLLLVEVKDGHVYCVIQ